MVWCGPSLKTPNLLGGFWQCPTPYPHPHAGRFDLSGAPLDVPCSITFSKHLYVKLTRQSQAETSAASVHGADRHHHLWPGQRLMSADGPSLRTRNSPSIWTRWGSCLAVIPIFQGNYFLESMFLSSCSCPILGLLVQVNRSVFSLIRPFYIYTNRQEGKLIIPMSMNI